MALAGVLISFGYCNGTKQPTLMGRFVWTENLTSPGTTSGSAATNHDPDRGLGTTWPTLEVSAAVDAIVAIGPTPDAIAGPRVLVRAGETRNFACVAGDKLAWAAA